MEEPGRKTFIIAWDGVMRREGERRLSHQDEVRNQALFGLFRGVPTFPTGYTTIQVNMLVANSDANLWGPAFQLHRVSIRQLMTSMSSHAESNRAEQSRREGLIPKSPSQTILNSISSSYHSR